MAQDNQRNVFTIDLIKRHVRPGMRILDVGCGNGEISLLLAKAVGDGGSVHGIDSNPAAIESAMAQKEASGAQNITFSVCDLDDVGRGEYDAVFSRRVLMYQPDARHAVEVLKGALKPGGIMLFQESDEAGAQLNGNRFPVHNIAQDWVWETVRRERGDTHIGSELYGILKHAGMRIIDYRSEVVLQTAETGSDLSWVVSMMQGRMRSLGIPVQTEGLDDRLSEELQNADQAFVRDLAFGICASNK